MLGNRIAELRKLKGLSQYELADRLGFSRGKLSNYEQGSRQPDYETLKKIADYFDVSLDFLITGQKDTAVKNASEDELHLSPEELKILEEIKKYPILFHDFATASERKKKQLVKMWEIIKSDYEDDDVDDDVIDDL
ncbi:helix-turn-helix transcriptional regulator [Metabacillus fastidiosus]|uniref:helix-turn-helix domain-containing protein n=1 Tax=Metabacillus fastidiosus TaxID=1458 RepID=UPI003D27C600